MGCPTSGGCTGYELRADLSFDENGDGQMTSAGDPTYWNSGNGWVPLNGYTATFRGNGHTVSYLYVNRSSMDNAGLFGNLNAGSAVDGVGLPHADVTGRNFVGAIAGASGGDDRQGVEHGAGPRRPQPGRIDRPVGWRRPPGQLVDGDGQRRRRHVQGGRAGRVYHGQHRRQLVGRTGRLHQRRRPGGRRRRRHGHRSYWDAGTSGQSTSAAGTGKTTRDLQRPTAYGSTGSIYANWNLNLDGVTGGDDPWDFGTSRQYPALKFTGRTTYRGPAWIEADHWNAPVAGEPLVAGLYTKTARALVDPAATITTCDGVANTNSRQAWVWERSDDGRTSWTTVTSTRGPACSYVYVPSAGDVGKYLRARVARTSGGDAYTLATAAVVSSSAATAATATFAGGNASPVVGTAVTVSPLPTHSDRTVWRWQRCTASDGTGTCTLLAPGTPSWSYTPVAADVGGYLRAFVYYSSGASTPVWTRAATGFTGAVAASN